jgi:hypothetical protein
MRGGVPASLWSTTVTLYGQGAPARRFVGDSGGPRTQVVLLDAAGLVAFHDAGGFSEESAARLAATVAALADQARRPQLPKKSCRNSGARIVSSSAGDWAMSSAPASTSCSGSCQPQETPTGVAPASRASRTSPVVSPTYQ